MPGPKRVLVVDDERVVCDSCQRVLRQEGYQVSTTTDGREGVERASREEFDAVIVDLRMPGFGGMDVLRVIKRNSPETPVIIITGYSSVGTAVEVMQLGAADYLPKPFTPKELAQTVGRSLRRAETPLQPDRERTLPPSFPPQETLPQGVEKPPEKAPAAGQILLAGSDAETMEALQRCLSSEPWEVRSTRKHEEIVARIREGHVDVLVLGMNVGGKKAYELIPEMKKLDSRIPIIVTSSDPSVELARRIRESGIFFYLMEPFEAEEARAAVRDALRKAAALRAKTEPPIRRGRRVRGVRTVARNGSKIGFLAIGEWLQETHGLHRQIVDELKQRGMPAHTELSDRGLTPEELARRLERDDRVIMTAVFEENATSREIVTYSATDFEKFATGEQRAKMKELAYPEVLHWLRARGIAPEVKIVCLSGEYLTGERIATVVRTIINLALW
jgi:DNA-binding response OmpR family regulator